MRSLCCWHIQCCRRVSMYSVRRWHVVVLKWHCDRVSCLRRSVCLFLSVRVRIVALCVAEEDYESHIASVLQSPAAVIFKVRMCWRRSHCDSAPCVLGFLPMITCCTAGKWGAGTAACTSCDVGTFSIAAASACTQCAAGTWSNLTGTATACPACPGQSLRYRRVGVHLAGAFPPISSVSCVVCVRSHCACCSGVHRYRLKRVYRLSRGSVLTRRWHNVYDVCFWSVHHLRRSGVHSVCSWPVYGKPDGSLLRLSTGQVPARAVSGVVHPVSRGAVESRWIDGLHSVRG